MAVVTFEPHPARVLRPESAPLLLIDLDQKLELLERHGVDTTVVVPFTAERSHETADEFIEHVLVGCLNAQAVIVGRDFHFGANRAGNVDTLRAAGARFGFVAEGVELLPRPDARIESVSSTAIRRALAGGEVSTAARMLGRHHEIRGPVVPGDQRGRTIGFPTANVAVPKGMALPADAVYAAWYLGPDGKRWPAAVNVGKTADVLPRSRAFARRGAPHWISRRSVRAVGSGPTGRPHPLRAAILRYRRAEGAVAARHPERHRNSRSPTLIGSVPLREETRSLSSTLVGRCVRYLVAGVAGPQDPTLRPAVPPVAPSADTTPEMIS